MTSRYNIIIAAAVLALAQIGFLGWMIAGRAALLRSGQEVLLKVEPVDPRDLLRGDFVRLGYEISRLPVEKIENLPESELTATEGPVVVRLKKDADGYWRATAAWLGDAAATPAGAGEVDIAGRIGSGWSLAPGSTIGVDYGIERFYVPEGEGLAIERDMRVRSFGIKLAVGKDGSSQIKALVDGDKALFEEPLY
ncbi:GDYXXLXY domain-containing protein [Mesorhizobium sp. ANAO-SY3R2]|uniref:GDYXXLXY domain-containing protein n=1 Tax=Mesorhizobium sp. ANAO-SY3R2 TaxID=3166644 RepID=UPI00366C7896